MTEDSVLYGGSSSRDTQDPLTRVFEAAECRTQSELAVFLGIRQSSIADAKKRNAIPAEWLIKLLRRKSINPEWVLTGLGSKNLGPADGEPATYGICFSEGKPPQKCSAQELVTELVRRALVTL